MRRSTFALCALFAACGLLVPLETAHATITWTGDISPVDPTKWNEKTKGYIGKSADGSLTVDGRSSLFSGYTYLGYNSNATGRVMVTGPGSTWTSSGTIVVGTYGRGTLTIANAGTVRSAQSNISSPSGLIAEGTVTGAGSTWFSSGNFHVGSYGNGRLTIADGGRVSVADTTHVAFGVNSSGSITFGPGDATLSTGSLFASPAQFAGTGTVNTHGLVSDVDMTFDALHGLTQVLRFTDNTARDITVNFDMSSPENVGDLGVGYLTNGSLLIRDGITVESRTSYLGYKSGASGTATITGAGSTWNHTIGFGLRVGYDGSGTLTIDQGAHVNSANTYVGCDAGSTGRAVLRGTGSTWTVRDGCLIGFSGSGTLTISEGGTLDNHYTGWIGANPGSTGEAIVAGLGSTWINVSELWVGDEGKGTLSVTDGGFVSNTSGYIGRLAGSRGETTVRGIGSTWVNTSALSVGHIGNGSLTITEGGLVTVGKSLTIDANGGDDSFINMATGGMLALSGDADDSLADFLNLIHGTDAIRYWNDSIAKWADITSTTPGVDYTLAYVGDTGSDLYGYTLLTVGVVPEPGTNLMLLIGASMLLLRRALGRMRV